jgi:hypothetical protein
MFVVESFTLVDLLNRAMVILQSLLGEPPIVVLLRPLNRPFHPCYCRALE